MGSIEVAYPADKWMSEQEIEKIKSIKLPHPKPPFPIKKNKHAKEAIAEAHEWVRQPALCKMYRSEKVLNAHTSADVDLAGLAMQVFTDVEEKKVAFSAKLILFTFALDDYIDGGTTFDDPTKSAELIWEISALIMWSFPDDTRLHELFVEAVSSADVNQRDTAFAYMDRKLTDAKLSPGTLYDTSSAETSPFCKAIGELWATVAETSPRQYLLRFGIAIQNYVLTYLTEVSVRNRNVVLSLKEYVLLRRHTVAMELFMVVDEFLHDSYLPTEVIASAEVQKFVWTCVDVVAWLNDVASFKKEILQGDVFNLVGVISKQENCTYEEAAERTFRMTMDRIADVDKDIKALEQVTGPEHRSGIENYIQCGKNWVWGSYEWNCRTGRYNFDV